MRTLHTHTHPHSPAPAQVYLPWPGDPDFGGPQFPDHFPLLFLPPPSLCLNACPVLPLVRFWMPIKAQTLPRRPRPLQDPDWCPQGPFWEDFWMHHINTPWAPISFTFLSLFHGSILEWIYYNCYIMFRFLDHCSSNLASLIKHKAPHQHTEMAGLTIHCSMNHFNQFAQVLTVHPSRIMIP